MMSFGVPFGNQKRVPDGYLETGQASFGDGRNVRQADRRLSSETT